MSYIDKMQERVDKARQIQADHDVTDARAWKLSGAPATLALFLLRKEAGDVDGAKRVLSSIDSWDFK